MDFDRKWMHFENSNPGTCMPCESVAMTPVLFVSMPAASGK
jgi:hypothetical protein